MGICSSFSEISVLFCAFFHDPDACCLPKADFEVLLGATCALVCTWLMSAARRNYKFYISWKWSSNRQLWAPWNTTEFIFVCHLGFSYLTTSSSLVFGYTGIREGSGWRQCEEALATWHCDAVLCVRPPGLSKDPWKTTGLWVPNFPWQTGF